jgi:hypothetical protein
MQLVGGGATRQDCHVGGLEVGDVGCLSFIPVGLQFLERVGAAFDDFRDAVAKTGLDLAEHSSAALIFRCIVKKRS